MLIYLRNFLGWVSNLVIFKSLEEKNTLGKMGPQGEIECQANMRINAEAPSRSIHLGITVGRCAYALDRKFRAATPLG
eukprot:229721-Amorphochlora_amoeboformis.AAC.1